MYVPPGLGARNPYISALYEAFATLILVFMQVGGVEVLYGNIVKFYERMRLELETGIVQEVHAIAGSESWDSAEITS